METQPFTPTPISPSVQPPVQTPSQARKFSTSAIVGIVVVVFALAYTVMAMTMNLWPFAPQESTPSASPSSLVSFSPSPSASASTSPTTPPAGWKGVYLGGFSFFLPPGWGLMGEESGEISPIEGDSYRSASSGIAVGQVGSSGDRLLEVNVFTDKNYYRKPGDSFEESIAALWRIQPKEGPGIKVGEYIAKAFSGSSSDPRAYFIADLGSRAIAMRSTVAQEDLVRILATFQFTQ